MKRILFIIFTVLLLACEDVPAQAVPSVTYHVSGRTYPANTLVSKDGVIYKALSSTSTTPPGAAWEELGTGQSYTFQTPLSEAAGSVSFDETQITVTEGQVTNLVDDYQKKTPSSRSVAASYTTNSTDSGGKVIMTAGTQINLDDSGITPPYNVLILNNTGAKLTWGYGTSDTSIQSPLPDLPKNQYAYAELLASNQWSVVVGGVTSTGVGDMLKSEYDVNDDGFVDQAEYLGVYQASDFELDLGNPAGNGYVLQSTAAGVRSWTNSLSGFGSIGATVGGFGVGVYIGGTGNGAYDGSLSIYSSDDKSFSVTYNDTNPSNPFFNLTPSSGVDVHYTNSIDSIRTANSQTLVTKDFVRRVDPAERSVSWTLASTDFGKVIHVDAGANDITITLPAANFEGGSGYGGLQTTFINEGTGTVTIAVSGTATLNEGTTSIVIPAKTGTKISAVQLFKMLKQTNDYIAIGAY